MAAQPDLNRPKQTWPDTKELAAAAGGEPSSKITISLLLGAVCSALEPRLNKRAECRRSVCSGPPSPADQRVLSHVGDQFDRIHAAVALGILHLLADWTKRLALEAGARCQLA
jgi:hypothetical protein